MLRASSRRFRSFPSSSCKYAWNRLECVERELPLSPLFVCSSVTVDLFFVLSVYASLFFWLWYPDPTSRLLPPFLSQMTEPQSVFRKANHFKHNPSGSFGWPAPCVYFLTYLLSCTQLGYCALVVLSLCQFLPVRYSFEPTNSRNDQEILKAQCSFWLVANQLTYNEWDTVKENES